MQVQLNVVRGRGAPQLLDLQAASLADARAHAIGLGYSVLSMRRARTHWGDLLGDFGAKPRFDVPVFIEQLRDLLQAGLSVIEASCRC